MLAIRRNIGGNREHFAIIKVQKPDHRVSQEIVFDVMKNIL